MIDRIRRTHTPTSASNARSVRPESSPEPPPPTPKRAPSVQPPVNPAHVQSAAMIRQVLEAGRESGQSREAVLEAVVEAVVDHDLPGQSDDFKRDVSRLIEAEPYFQNLFNRIYDERVA